MIPGAVVAADLDGDGWDDLVFNRPAEGPLAVRNSARGALEPLPLSLGAFEGRPLLVLAAVDVSGDGLLELFSAGQGFVAVADNLGGGRFARWRPVWRQEGWPQTCVGTLAFADLDGDNDLDLSVPGLDLVPSEGVLMGSHQTGYRGSVDRLLRNDQGRCVEDRELPRGGGSPASPSCTPSATAIWTGTST